MAESDSLFQHIAPRLEGLVKSNAVVGPIISVGDRHAIPLVELSLGLGGGGGGEGEAPRSGEHGLGAGAGGGTKVTPVAVVVVEGSAVHIQTLAH